MEKEKIFEILIDSNFWDNDLESGITRTTYLNKMERFLKDNYILAIIGPRRAGKSILMRQYAKLLFSSGIEKKDTLFVNLEEPRFTYRGNLSLKLLQDIYETYIEYLQPGKKPYIFLDEVQVVPEWERFVRSLHERNCANIIVSGSNSKLLSYEYGSLLTGRYLPVEVFPLSFDEFLLFKNIYLKDNLQLIKERMKIRNLFREYLENGGFPQVTLSESKKDILNTYYADIINKDIISRFKVRETRDLQTLTNHYLTSISSLITFNKIEISFNINTDTAKRFSEYLECVYLVFFVYRFSYSLKERTKSPRKVYGIDTGLRNVVGFRSSNDYGRLLENIVFLELKRRGIEVYYWKDQSGKEVDFVIKSDKKVTNLVQVCWDVEDIDVKKREILPLLKVMEEFNLKEGLVITSDYKGEEKFKERLIRFIPAWKWLLKEDEKENKNEG